NLTAGQAMPLLDQASLTLTASLTPGVADLNARIAGLLAASIAPPALITDLVAGLTAALGSLQALIAAGVVVIPPTATASLEQLAVLQAQLTALQTGLDFAASLPLGAPGIHVYTTASPANGVGSDISGALAGGLPGEAGPS